MGVNTVELVCGCKHCGTGVWVQTQWNWCVGANAVDWWEGKNAVELVGGCKHSGTGVWV